MSIKTIQHTRRKLASDTPLLENQLRSPPYILLALLGWWLALIRARV
jgi:hypothetical protein